MSITEGAWAEYRPTAEDPWDLRKVAHLHRRAGLGATWGELQRDFKDGPAASVERLLRPPTPTEEEKDALAALRQGVLDSRDAERLKAWWLYRLLWDADPLREKLTLFWHNHFATSNRKVQSVPLMIAQNETFRKHALGEFGPLVTDMVSDGAMLIWLDGAGSSKQRPNENFGREFLELFTLGIGNYREKDIREAARAFTGWTRSGGNQFNGEAGTFRFDPAQFDDGPKTFLGRSGAWKPADIIRITLEQPACAEFLCKKLYRFLVGEAGEPDADLIRPLAQELRKNRYSIRQVVKTILRSKHFYSAAYRQRVKCPVEFSAGLVRLLEVPREDVRLLALAVACDREGQELFAPPNVKGWDGGRTWINSTTVLERGNWVTHLVWGEPNLGMKPFDVAAWARRHDIAPEKTVAALTDLVLQNDLGEKARALVTKAGQNGKPDSLRKALQLLLNCPEFQLA
jgi:uncharacterized protein (DUF1800 family)